ncbi:hypothetical protein ACTFIZ_006730 [Dictyostelium cf. discoideum]
MSFSNVINPVYLIHGTAEVQLQYLRSILDNTIISLLKMVVPDWLQTDKWKQINILNGLQKLYKYRSLIEKVDRYYISILLNPMVKLTSLSKLPWERSRITFHIDKLENEYNRECEKLKIKPKLYPCIQVNNQMKSIFDNEINLDDSEESDHENFVDRKSSIIEINQYLSEKEVETSNILIRISKNIFGISASLVPIERTFSKAGNFVTDRRNDLSPQHISESTLLSEWSLQIPEILEPIVNSKITNTNITNYFKLNK